MYLEAADVPQMIRDVFKDYNGRKFEVQAVEQVTLGNNYWEGGSRTEYRGLDLSTGQVFMPGSNEYGNPFVNPDIPTVALAPGKAIVGHKIFMGKDFGLVIYVHPENLTKLIKDQTPIAEDEKTVLVYTKCLKSSYGPTKNFRFVSAKGKTGITLERWEAAKVSLIAKGLLNKAGAITPAGRNAVDGERP